MPPWAATVWERVGKSLVMQLWLFLFFGGLVVVGLFVVWFGVSEERGGARVAAKQSRRWAAAARPGSGGAATTTLRVGRSRACASSSFSAVAAEREEEEERLRVGPCLAGASLSIDRSRVYERRACARNGKTAKEQQTHAVLRPCSDRPTAARRPAPPAPTTMASYWWSMIG